LYYHLKYSSEELTDIAHKLSYVSLKNIEWSCLYSGMGIIHPLSEKEIKKLLQNQNTKESINELASNVNLLKCIYKKGKPIFSTPPDDVPNKGRYMWDFNSFNKTILCNSQAFAILSLCKAAEILIPSNKPLSMLMIKNAEIYFDFASTYLRNEEGLFISVEDKSKNTNFDELKLKPCQKESKLIDQVFMHEALVTLYYTVSKDEFKEFCSQDSIKYLDHARALFHYIFENYYMIYELTSKEISLCISSLSRCCAVENNHEQVVNYNHIIALLCAELESRIKITGEVEKSFNNSSPASLVTHFRVASAFMEGFVQTNIEKFKDISFMIMNYLNDLYDVSTGLFIQGDDNKLSCSIRGIAEMLKCLWLHCLLFKGDQKTIDTIYSLYKASVEESGIIQCIPEKTILLNDNNIVFTDTIPLAHDVNKAPVFMRSFKINFKKASACSASKHFNSLYSLYSSYLFLNYIYPYVTPCVKEEKTESYLPQNSK
jgi:hypothetical protein